jgi:hypothetical protein
MTAAPVSRAHHSTAGEIARDDPLPLGPFSVGLMHGPKGALEWPFTVVCGDGRAIAGHVNSRACAEAIVDALNHSGRRDSPAVVRNPERRSRHFPRPEPTHRRT